MDIKDIFLTPVYLTIFYLIINSISSSSKDKEFKKILVPAITLKFIGAIAMGIIYQFYYSNGYLSGDTSRYFNQGKYIANLLLSDPGAAIQLLLFKATPANGQLYLHAIQLDTHSDKASFFVTKLTAFLCLFSLNTYSVVACIFAMISFSGLYAMYVTFSKIYPALQTKFSIACFFIPSVFFWGSGILKDTICIAALGWLFFSFYRGFIERKKVISSMMIFLIAAYVLQTVKVYIILSFAPAMLLWLFVEYNNKITNPVIKYLSMPFFLGLGIVTAYFAGTKITEGDELYSIENIGQRAKITADYIYAISVQSGGSAYTLGELDGTISGMLKLAPQAINVSLFRPYIWEVRNPVMLLSALESLVIFILTGKILLKNGIIKSIKSVFTSPILSLCFIFSLTFAFAVGVTSYNFGTLVRYKIPLLPFYVAGLYILHYRATSRKAV
jgi:hypothetical protein